MMLGPDERRDLLAVARAAITARVSGLGYLPPQPAGGLAARLGAFVTLHLRAELRGCIGHIEPDRPLVDVVARCAAAAAVEDPRFPPLSIGELSEVVIEISVLGPIRPLAPPFDVEIGRHGLVVSHGDRRGLLLPQVAVEWGWDRQAFLAQTCVKAGLRPDAWRTGADMFAFEAEVFGET